MNGKCDLKREELIDFVEGELAPERAREIEAHIDGCQVCAAYVESLKRTFSLLSGDTVPEPPPGYWTYFAQRVRQHAGSRRRRRILVLAPGMAALALILIFVWWGTQTPVPEMDDIELITAGMSTEELVESVSGSQAYDDMLLEVAEEELILLDEYFTETEDIYDLIDTLSDAEVEAFMAELNSLMRDSEGTSQVITDSQRKEC